MGTKGKILVVEDQPGICILLKEFFQQNGWTVLVAQNGYEGLELTRTHTFCFAFIDMKMPVMDGVTLIKYLVEEKREFQWALMTAYGEAELAEKATKLGTVAVIPKPFNLDELLELVQTYV